MMNLSHIKKQPNKKKPIIIAVGNGRTIIKTQKNTSSLSRFSFQNNLGNLIPNSRNCFSAQSSPRRTQDTVKNTMLDQEKFKKKCKLLLQNPFKIIKRNHKIKDNFKTISVNQYNLKKYNKEFSYSNKKNPEFIKKMLEFSPKIKAENLIFYHKTFDNIPKRIIPERVKTASNTLPKGARRRSQNDLPILSSEFRTFYKTKPDLLEIGSPKSRREKWYYRKSICMENKYYSHNFISDLEGYRIKHTPNFITNIGLLIGRKINEVKIKRRDTVLNVESALMKK